MRSAAALSAASLRSAAAFSAAALRLGLGGGLLLGSQLLLLLGLADRRGLLLLELARGELLSFFSGIV